MGLLLSVAEANNTAQTLPFSQDWTNTGLITANDDWAGVPGIIGYLGDNLTSANDVDPQTVVADGTTTVDVIANQTSPNITNGGVAEFHIANPVVALQGSGTADAPFILLHVDTTGKNSINVAYNLRDIDGSADNAVQQVALQFRVGSSGNFTNVPAGYVADATTGPSLATLVTPVSVTLPAAANNQSLVQIRIITTNAGGNDEWVGIDDISVTGSNVTTPTPPTGVGAATPGTVAPGASSLLTVTVTPGTNPASTGITVAGDLTSIGGSAAQTFFDNGTNGDAMAGDNVFSFNATVAPATPDGAKTLPITVADAQMRSSSTTITLNVSTPPPAAGIVISQVYGGGGNSGATLTNDFIELFNRTSTTISVNGWSVQYNSGNGAGTWQTTPINGSIPPGGYFLVQEAAGAGGTENLPTPDATGTIAMAAASGKVAVVSNTTALTGACPVGGHILDLLGYGTANCSETAPMGQLSNTTAGLRRFGGCIDTDNNSDDFSSGSPLPRNSATPIHSCAPTARQIHEIQGAGATSPFVGDIVSTSGIVTSIKSNGFFIQQPDATIDNNPNTSEGIFVFAPGAVVAVGDAVTVEGEVGEFFRLTQISTLPSFVTVGSGGNPLPAAIALTPAILDPAGAVDQLERLESMRVSAASLTTVSPTNEFGEIFTVLTGVARPFREPGIEISRALPPGAPANVPRFDENPEALMVDTDGRAGSVSLVVTAGVTLTGVTGPLDFTFDDYKVIPDAAPTASANIMPTAVPEPCPGEFTVASMNLLNFFTTNSNFNDRVAKASLVIRTIVRMPDIIGFEEVGDIAALTALANKVNSDAVAGGSPNPGYTAHLLEGDDAFPDDIDVGFLVKTSRVSVTSVTQHGKGLTFTDPGDGSTDTLFERPPLVLRATVQASVGAPLPVTVMVNHPQSLIEVDQDPGRGPRQRLKRKLQAEFTANLAQSIQNENLIMVGDFNAFQFNDGYVDVMGTIKGMPTPADQVVLASPDLVNPNIIDLVETGLISADQRYSFVFAGNAQVLDHILVDQEMFSRTSRFTYARNNADFPESFGSDPTRPERIADHDIPVAYFRVPPSVSCPADIVTNADPGQCSAVVNFTVPATGGCGEGVTVVASPASGSVFPKGTTTVNVTATDSLGQTATCSFTVTVNDGEPPALTCGVGLAELWSPNHDLANVDLSVTAEDNCDPNVSVSVQVFSDEDDVNAGTDDDQSPDAKDAAPGSLRLRKERSGEGDGRVYLIIVTATDSSGNVSRCCKTVTVPKSNSAASKASVAAQAEAARAHCEQFGAPPAGFFLIGDGPVVGSKQ